MYRENNRIYKSSVLSELFIVKYTMYYYMCSLLAATTEKNYDYKYNPYAATVSAAESSSESASTVVIASTSASASFIHFNSPRFI